MVAHNPVLYQSSDRRDLNEQGRLCVTVSKAGFEGLRELTVTGSVIFLVSSIRMEIIEGERGCCLGPVRK